MDRHKLVQIIANDLEELKALTEEVAENQDDSLLIIELALSKARILCQEIELMRELSSQSTKFRDEKNDEADETFDSEVSDLDFPEPELEILNFEEREVQEEEELANEVEPDDTLIAEDDVVDEDDDNEPDEDDLSDDDDFGDKENEEDEIEDEDQEPLQNTNIQVTELKNDTEPGVREIQIEDLDEEEEPIHFSPLSGSSGHPEMHEIQKPDTAVQGKTVVGDTFQKEPSVNDVIAENKSAELNLNFGPISSLRAAIGLNDRFIFIREIFGNNSEKYNTIIENLDKMETIQEAVEYLKANLTLQKNDTSLKFVDLLKRRFSK